MTRLSSRLGVAVLCIAAGVCVVGSTSSAASTSSLATELGSVENQVVQSDMSGVPNPRAYYTGGQWYASEGSECWNCYDSAATAAAVLFDQKLGGLRYLDAAIETTNSAIAQRQQRDGSFEGTPSANGPITTGFYGVELGITYLELRKVLDDATRHRWATALEAAADYLISSGQMTWYINGNVNLRQTEIMWLTWQATGNPYFKQKYEDEWSFTIHPPESRWAGFGLQLTVAPTRTDDSDGSGYLAESAGAGTPGFDPEYTMVQLDTATQMYVLSREARWLGLMNLLFNRLKPLIEITPLARSTWELNATNGTRKNQHVAFIAPAPYVLVASGDRPDLEAGLAGQFSRIQHDFLKSELSTNEYFYKGLSDLSTVLLSDQWPSGIGAHERPAGSVPTSSSTAPESLPAGTTAALTQPASNTQASSGRGGAGAAARKTDPQICAHWTGLHRRGGRASTRRALTGSARVRRSGPRPCPMSRSATPRHSRIRKASVRVRARH